MNRGVEIAAEVADLPNAGHHPAGRERRGRAHGGPVLAARLGRAPRGWPPMRDLVLKGGHGRRRRRLRGGPTCVVSDGRIAAVGTDLSGARGARRGGCVVAPGLVDLHTHLRQPGREEAETVETGSRAAALGGFTAVVAMPNTEPAIDYAAVVREVQELGRAAALCDVARRRCHHRRPGRRAAGADGRDGRARRAAVHRRRHRRAGRPPHAPGPGVRRRPRRHPGPALRGHCPRRRRPHARGGVVEPPRHPRPAGRGRGADGACATSRWPA